MKDRNGELPHDNQSDMPKERALKTFWHYLYANLIQERKPSGWDVMVEKNFSDRRKEQAPKSFWNEPYAGLVRERKPPGWSVKSGRPLSLAPESADQLLRYRDHGERRDHEARVMRGLWPHLTRAALLELKGPSNELRQGDLAKLISYGWKYLAEDDSAASRPRELTLVLVVPTQTPTLLQEFDRCEVQAEPLADGYVRLSGADHHMVVVLLDRVADAEQDDTEDMIDAIIETLGVDEVLGRVPLKQRLAGLDAEQRLAGLDAEQLKRLQAVVNKKLDT